MFLFYCVSFFKMKKGRVPHNKTNVMRRVMEVNREISKNLLIKKKQTQMFASVKEIK